MRLAAWLAGLLLLPAACVFAQDPQAAPVAEAALAAEAAPQPEASPPAESPGETTEKTTDETTDGAPPLLDPDALAMLAVEAALPLVDEPGPVAVSLWAGGRQLGETVWADEGFWPDSAAKAMETALAGVEPDRWAAVDGVALHFTHGYQDVAIGGARDAIHRRFRGVRGLQLRHRNRQQEVTPLEMLLEGQDFGDVIQAFTRRAGIRREDIGDAGIQLRAFYARQVLVMLEPEPMAVPLLRANEPMPQEAVDPGATWDLADGLGGWLVRNLGPDGRMTYRYDPYQAREPRGNNMIRQWMATVCLGRWARFEEDEAVLDAFERNLAFNLAEFYEQDGEFGYIAYGGQAKLGAMALAALALVERGSRPGHATREAALLRTIDRLWNADGSFDTFYKPAGRGGNENFYPGEALLTWATLYARDRDPALLERFMTSFRYYRAWHRENRNPAFVPWHTQAYYNVWQVTRDAELQEFVFEMNDWLVETMQPDDEEAFPDTRGRFYNPRYRLYGPPHASSTGVYLEGLADAWSMAREAGDEARAEHYRLAMLRGLRSAMQLQFADEVDLFFVPAEARERVRRGMRTAVYDPEIRVDNVQHVLMAVMKVLDRFGPDEYALAVAASAEDPATTAPSAPEAPAE